MRLTLGDLLIIPIQRIPRYVLLLEQIHKKSRKSHPDYNDLESAIQKLKDTAADINKKKGESMKLQAVMDLLPKLTNYPGAKLGDLATPDRMLIMEGELFERSSAGGYKERHVFLFSDMLLCAKSNAQQGLFKSGVMTYEFKWAYMLVSHGMDSVAPSEEVQTKESSKTLYPIIFNWQTDRGYDRKILATSSEDERQEWETTFKKLKGLHSLPLTFFRAFW